MLLCLMCGLSVSQLLIVTLFFPDISPAVEGDVQHIASKRFELGGTELTKLFDKSLENPTRRINLSMSDV